MYGEKHTDKTRMQLTTATRRCPYTVYYSSRTIDDPQAEAEAAEASSIE